MKRRHCVLVVDDNPIVRTVSRARLEAAGFDAIVVSSPFELASTLAAHPVDAALIDVGMPALKGHDLVRIVRKDRTASSSGHNCLLLLYSDRTDDDLSELAAASGADGYVSKSRGYDYLLRKLRGLLGRRSPLESAH